MGAHRDQPIFDLLVTKNMVKTVNCRLLTVKNTDKIEIARYQWILGQIQESRNGLGYSRKYALNIKDEVIFDEIVNYVNP